MLIEVRHATNGDGEYRPTKVVTRTVAAWYSPTKVRDNVGDVWFVKRKGNKLVTTG